jgi:hypothetical protein
MALLAWGDCFYVLQYSNQTWHALWSNQTESSIPNLINCLSLFKGVLFDSTDIGVFWAHDNEHLVSHLGNVQNRHRIIPVHF